MMTLTAEQRLTKARIAVMRNPKFILFSGAISLGKCTVNDSEPTARTNGRDEWWGRKFIERLNDKQLMFVVLHETLHKVGMHTIIWKKLLLENHNVANVALDIYVNSMLLEMDKEEKTIEFPIDPDSRKVFDELARICLGWNCKQIYDYLLQNHVVYVNLNIDKHDIEIPFSDIESDQLKRDVDNVLRQGRIAKSKLGLDRNNADLMVDDLLDPKVRWQDYIHDFSKQSGRGIGISSWHRINRRFLHTGCYMPSMTKSRVGTVGVFIDTSGSTDGFLSIFMSELVGVFEDLNPEKLILGYWDEAMDKVEEYNNSNIQEVLNSTSPVGGGGTDPNVIKEYLRKNKIQLEYAIILTDGFFGIVEPDWGIPLLWCILNNPEADIAEGKVLYIEHEAA